MIIKNCDGRSDYDAENSRYELTTFCNNDLKKMRGTNDIYLF